MKRIPCSGCSLLCDDIIVDHDEKTIKKIIGACLKGKERFDQVSAKNRILSPQIRINGDMVSVTWGEAIEKTIELLKNSTNPLLYGFSNVSCEAQLKGIKLARKINGFIDSNSIICQGKLLDSSKETGITLTTLTEIINKSDVLILWGANPAESIPRLLNKTLFSRGKFRMTGREIKSLIIIDPVKTKSFGVMGVKDLSLFIEPNKDLELIRLLKDYCCSTEEYPSEGIAGIDKDDLKRLLMNLRGFENAVIIVGQGMLRPNADGNVIKELLELVSLINENQEKGRISVLTLGGHFNMIGFDHIALANAGKNYGLEFKNNNLLENKDTIVSKLEKNEFDCSFIVATDPISHLPQKLSKYIASKPLIVLDNRRSGTTILADVVLPTALTGIEADGLAFRLDHVPIQLQKIIDPPKDIKSDEEILDLLINQLMEGS